MPKRRLQRPGTVERAPEAVAALRGQRRLFVETFGREPGPSDPVFFDPDADRPQPMDLDRARGAVVELLRRAGVDPAVLFAFERTGKFLTAETADRWSARDLAAWDGAIAEYRRQRGPADN